MKGCKSKAISAADRRAIMRVASNSCLPPRKILEKCGVNVSVSTVKRMIYNCEHLKKQKIKKKVPLNPKHKELRLIFAREHMTWNKEWKMVIFSGEKKFNIDGPDGYSYYFYYSRKEEVILTVVTAKSVELWYGEL